MTISGNLAAKPVELQRTYQPPQTAAAQIQKPSFTRRFDSVTISGENSQTFAAQARMQLVNDVRTANASSTVSAIREEIRNGTFQPDSMEIARKLLLLGEDA